jgi:hypothetical protein
VGLRGELREGADAEIEASADHATNVPRDGSRIVTTSLKSGETPPDRAWIEIKVINKREFAQEPRARHTKRTKRMKPVCFLEGGLRGFFFVSSCSSWAVAVGRLRVTVAAVVASSAWPHARRRHAPQGYRAAGGRRAAAAVAIV